MSNIQAYPEVYRSRDNLIITHEFSKEGAYRQLETMSAYPRFFSQPFRYLRWAAIEKPAIFYSIVIGSLGPVLVVAVPPIRTRLGDPKRPEIPLTYPIPTSPRKPLDGYDDEW